MKPQELKIGNLVCYNGEVVKVEQVTKRKIGYHTKPNETRLNYARLCEIEPIPITEKLLRKRIGGDKVTYFISHGNSMLTFKKLDDALWDVLIEVSLPNYREIRQYIYNIQYIHQLQNAYYLTADKELEIKL